MYVHVCVVGASVFVFKKYCFMCDTTGVRSVSRECFDQSLLPLWSVPRELWDHVCHCLLSIDLQWFEPGWIVYSAFLDPKRSVYIKTNPEWQELPLA